MNALNILLALIRLSNYDIDCYFVDLDLAHILDTQKVCSICDLLEQMFLSISVMVITTRNPIKKV